jgi:glycosyltransferase involved in cell wall biosynthesis
MLQQLRSQAQTRGLAPDCIFAPATANAAERLRAIDIFVLPSRSEALSNSLLEAMACGCCPVASRVGGNVELIHHGQNGMLFEAGNVDQLRHALERLIEHRVLRQRLAARARRDAEGFSIAQSARRMEAIYTELIR